jgi:DNA invertase Pin-like site-specific DNA recombinase
MSTELQTFSTENQAKEIRKYAEAHGIQIVRTYVDEGKSGLKTVGREAFNRLITNVQAGAIDFSLILVHDVSRWGRFQDPDEAAHFEYICKKARVPVFYCAEQFDNNGGFGSNMHKALMRWLAGLHGQLLSQKVFNGQKNLIEHGFRQGGAPGVGLRRQLLDEKGTSAHRPIRARLGCDAPRLARIWIVSFRI